MSHSPTMSDNGPNPRLAPRFKSEILSSIPWSTSAISSSEVMEFVRAEGFVAFKGFLEQLQAYESRLFSLAGSSQPMMEMRRLLGVGQHSDSDTSRYEMARRSNMSATDGIKLCGLVCAYRLVDVMAQMEGSLPKAPHFSGQFDHDCQTIPGMVRLGDWPLICLDFRTTMTKLSKPVTGYIPQDTSDSLVISLLRLYTRNLCSQSHAKIEGNFIVAAVHLACMRELTSPRDSYPDLPEKLNIVSAELSGRQHDTQVISVSREAEDDLKTLSQLLSGILQQFKGNTDGLSMLRSPLQLALLISPITLLLPFQIIKRRFNRQHMLSINRHLGNGKTPLITEVETVIWKTLFSLATGRLDPSLLLFHLFETLPWAKIDSVTDEDERFWFNLTRRPKLHSRFNDASASPHHSPKLEISLDDSNKEDHFVHPTAISTDISDAVSAIEPAVDDNLTVPMGDLSDLVNDGMKDGCDNAGVDDLSTSIQVANPPDTNDVPNADFLTSEVHPNQEEEEVPDLESEEDAKNVGNTRSVDAATSQETQTTPSSQRRSRKKRKATVISGSENQESEKDLDPANILNKTFESIWEPAILKEFNDLEEISLKKDQLPAKISCDKELEAFDAMGVPHKFRPQAHFLDYLNRLKNFFGLVERGYENGIPLHIADPKRSVFKVISCTTFHSLAPQQLHSMLRDQNVVVTGCLHSNLAFDSQGLRTLAPLDSQVSVLDYSVPAEQKEDNNVPVTVSGLVKDILDNAQKPEGKILNGLDFPIWDVSPKERSTYAVDVVAWDYVRGKPRLGNFTTPYPTAHTTWGVASTANAISFVHINSDGFGSFVKIMCGRKVWGVYREAPNLSLSSVDVFLDEHFLLDDVSDKALYGFEAVVLRPGDLIFIKPGAPYFVYTPEHTICNGGHFYATCLMQATLRSLIHSFVLGNFITSITHHPSRMLLRRIIILYGRGIVENCIQETDVEYAHLPNIRTFDGVLDLLSACILSILANVLDFRTYSAPNQDEHEEASAAQKTLMSEYDRNGISANERLAICYTRGVALTIFDWVRNRLVITGPDGNTVEDLPSRFLVQILKSLLQYKTKAMQNKVTGAPHCDTASLRTQVLNVLQCDQLAERMWKVDGNSDYSLGFDHEDGYTVRLVDAAVTTIADHDDSQYLRKGITPLDSNFLREERQRSQGRARKRARLA